MENTTDTKERSYDVVVFGASGFTGKLVVEYLAKTYPTGQNLRWAIAGRSQQKLEAAIATLSHTAKRPDIVVADGLDVSSMRSLAMRSRAILSTVGPYALYGDALVAACAENGTHYCDLSAEVQWIRRMIDSHQKTAQGTGARIVHSCGFDSIPSDLGVEFLNGHASHETGMPCSKVDLIVMAMRGGGSGGTIASGLNILDESKKDPQVAKLLRDPYSLNPHDKRDGADKNDSRGARYNELAGRWTAPFVMAMINTRIVRRSNALLDYAYGKDFRYTESVNTGKGMSGRIKAQAYAAGLTTMIAASLFEPSRKYVINKIIPDPGEGPSADERENGFFNIALFGQRLDDGKIITARVIGDRDPGYGSTSKMLAESAVCLAQDDLPVGGGFWTPASAMGATLRNRLIKNAGVSFTIESI